MKTTMIMGRVSDGSAVEQITLAAEDLSVEILSWGAAIQSIHFAGVSHSLVLGLTTAEDYEQRSPYFGAIVGRVANRIGGGTFDVDGKTHHVTRNQAGRVTLHGGLAGSGKSNWRVAHVSDQSAILHLVLPDGRDGFPGTAQISCTYRITAPGTLDIELDARCDAPCPINFATHSYFNLNGLGPINGHRLWVPATVLTAIDEELVPTGALIPVADSSFDFRSARVIGDRVIDHNYCIAAARRTEPHPVAQLVGERVSLVVESTEPGLQVYTGDNVNINGPTIHGRPYASRAGVCLEPQAWPDGANHPHFPATVLRPGERYHQMTRYRFADTDSAPIDPTGCGG
jgi:aldose 1-epimerase